MHVRLMFWVEIKVVTCNFPVKVTDTSGLILLSCSTVVYLISTSASQARATPRLFLGHQAIKNSGEGGKASLKICKM